MKQAATGWKTDPKVKDWEAKKKKERKKTYIQASLCMAVGSIMALVGWWFVGPPWPFIVVGTAMFSFGVAAIYGQAVSDMDK